MPTGRPVTLRAGCALASLGVLAGAIAATPGAAAGYGDPLSREQWGLTAVAAASAWALLPQNPPETLVAIVDTGVDPTHPDLAGRLWRSPPGTPAPTGQGEIPAGSSGWDFVDQDSIPSPVPASAADAPPPGPFYDHGTKVAGIVAAEGGNGAGTVGVDPRARILALRACSSLAAGCLASAPAMEWAAAVGARVVNVSVGGFGRSFGEAAAIADHPETLFVVSAGNSGRDVDVSGGGHWPCVDPAPNVICVANTTRSDGLDPTSNYGRTSVDLAAPGTDILSTTVGGGYALGSGTSDAAPHVTGVASLLFSARPTASAEEVKAAILAGARPVPKLAGRLAVAGVVDARGALRVFLGLPKDPVCEAGALRCALGGPTAQITGQASPSGRPPVVRRAMIARNGKRAARLIVRMDTNGLQTTWRLVRRSASGAVVKRGKMRAARGASTFSVRLGQGIVTGRLVLVATNTAGTAHASVQSEAASK